MASPRYDDRRAHADAIVAAVRAAADPRAAVAAAVARDVRSGIPVAGRGIIAIGKAAAAMEAGCREGLAAAGVSASTQTWAVIVPRGSAPAGADARVWISDHPLPTSASLDCARRLAGIIERLRRGAAAGAASAARLALLISGGASSLVTLPIDGVTLDDVRAATLELMKAGATIEQLNTVRKHVDRLKGGRLAALAAPLGIDLYILSDVVGDDPSTIGSGPASPDATTYADAVRVLEEHGAVDAAPRLTAALRQAAAGVHGLPLETPKPGDGVFQGVRTRVVAGNESAVQAAAEAARSLGFQAAGTHTAVQGEAREVGSTLASRLAAVANQGVASAIVSGGETTVTVRGGGYGGRNQELALAAASGLAGRRAMLLSFATDGVDGLAPSGKPAAAGAIVDGETAGLAASRGLDIQAYLADSDSRGFFDALGGTDLIFTGPTGTNVCDVAVGLAYP